MSATISLVDANCVRMGRVAALVAEAQQLLGAEDIMDIFKRSLFDGTLDAPPFQVGEARNEPSNWLHMEIEAPQCSLPPNQAALKVRPKQLYGVGRSTVASVLLTTNALPGARADWEVLFDIGSPGYTSEGGYSALAAIPFRDFPERGRRELEAIIAPMAKLTAWFEQLGWPVWAFLARAAVKVPGSEEDRASEPAGGLPSAPDARAPGRPQKSAWPRIVQLVRQLASEHPDWQKKRLAFEAWSKAKEEFSEGDLPSIATIQRSMVDILNGGSG